MNDIVLEICIHFDGMEPTLLLIGHICDSDDIVIFTKNEAVGIMQRTVSTDIKDVDIVAKRSTLSKLKKFLLLHNTARMYSAL